MFRRTRLILFAFIVVTIVVGVTAWLFGTNAGAVQLVSWACRLVPPGTEIHLEGVSGTLAEGLTIKELTGTVRPGALSFSVRDLFFDAAWLHSLTHVPTINRLRVRQVDLHGVPDPAWLHLVPPPPAWGGFAGIKLPVQCRDLHVETVACRFSAGSPWMITLRDFHLMPPASASRNDVQPLVFEIDVGVASTAAGRAAFDGAVQQKTGVASGTVSGQLCGGNFTSEIYWEFGKNPDRISGFLQQGTCSLGRLNSWLSPVWQSHAPAVIEGEICGSGSWLISQRLGLLGNLELALKQVTCRLVPLSIPLFELSGRLTLAESRLGLQNPDCRLLGAPASLTLEIGLHSWDRPIWNIELTVPSLDIGSVFNDLPWVMRYSMGLMPISGLASLTARVGGDGPELLCVAQAPELRLNQPAGECLWTGRVEYRRSPVGGDRFTADWSWVASAALRPLPRILDRHAGGLFDQPQPPFQGRGQMTGTPHGAFFKGRFVAGGQQCDLRGTLSEGQWSRLEVGLADASGELQSSSSLDSWPSPAALALLSAW